MDCPRCGAFCSVLDETCECGQDLSSLARAKPVTRTREPPIEAKPIAARAPAPLPLHTSGVLRAAGEAMSASLPALLAVGALCLSPAILLDGLELAAPAPAHALSSATWGSHALLIAGLRSLLGFVAHGAMVFMVVEHLAGRRADVGRAVSKAGSRLGALIGASLLQTLLIFAGSLACLVPGFIVACSTFVAIPAVVVERAGPAQALRRSTALTRGRRPTILVVMLLVIAVDLALTASLLLLPAATGGPLRVVEWIVRWGFDLVKVVIGGVVSAVAYAQLRELSDGVDASSLASVFA